MRGLIGWLLVATVLGTMLLRSTAATAKRGVLVSARRPVATEASSEERCEAAYLRLDGVKKDLERNDPKRLAGVLTSLSPAAAKAILVAVADRRAAVTDGAIFFPTNELCSLSTPERVPSRCRAACDAWRGQLH